MAKQIEPPPPSSRTGLKPVADQSISDVCVEIRSRLEAGKRVRRSVLGDGRINVDRLLPFLVLYRQPAGQKDLGTAQLATAGAAYLVVTNDKRAHPDVVKLVTAVRDLSMDQFGAFLLVEFWSRPPKHAPITSKDDEPRDPGFRLFGRPDGAACDSILQVLAKHLAQIRSTGRLATVDAPTQPKDFPHRPKWLYPKLPPDVIEVGIEVEPSYRNSTATIVYPAVLRTLRTGLDNSLRHAVFHFARRETKYRPKNYHSLGRRALVKATWEVDEKLDRISSSFDFLMAVTPVNFGPLWDEFRKAKYERLPRMRYRPLLIDLARSKRELYSIPIERIEDPTIAALFREKQEELDRQLTMLGDRGTERFLLGSSLMYGRISRELVRTAEELLERVPATTRASAPGRALSPAEFVARAEREIAYYRGQWDGVDARVVTSPNVLAGLMVSKGNLIVASDSKMREHRADALMQHEIGTHLVTYYNGKAQRFAQLKSGLAGYEELQEGLAVLAEYLVSGMTPDRIRILAARVLSAKALVDGAKFVDTFRLLCRYGFAPKSAFQITLRVYRGGGFIKDCVYLRGLTQLLNYLAQGESFERLFVGKIALEHLQVIAELETRGVVLPAKLLPRYLERDDCRRRLAGLREGKKIVDLLDEESPE